MREPARVESGAEIECPGCGTDIPIRVEVCPHCELALL